MENLNQQPELDFHRYREAEKNSSTVVGNEKVPLKSYMKNKQDRVRKLKKAVARHGLRDLNTPSQSSQELLPNNVTTAGPDELLYESDYNDDLS